MSAAHLVPLGHTDPGAGDQQPLSLCPTNVGPQVGVWSHLALIVGAVELNSGPHACKAGVLTHWAISPALLRVLASQT